MWGTFFAVVFGISSVCHAAPLVPAGHAVHEQRSDNGAWKKVERINPDRILPVRIGLAQSNLEKGHDWLMSISDPDSEHYGKHYTSEQIINLFSPSNDTLNAVHKWLVSEGVNASHITHSDNRGWYAFDTKASKAESILKTEFHMFEHVKTGRRSVGTDYYSIPSYLTPHVDYVTPGVKLHAPHGKKQLESREVEKRAPITQFSFPTLYASSNSTNSTNPLARCDQEITPACIRALYEITLPQTIFGGKPQSNNALGIFERGDTYLQDNLDKFFRNFTPWIPQGTHPTPNFVDGAKAPGTLMTDTGESDLDFILAYPLIYPQEIKLFQSDDEFYTTHTQYGDGIFNTFLDAIDGSYCTYKGGDDRKIDPHYPDLHLGSLKDGFKGRLMCGVYKPTPVISMSYGEEEANFPQAYQTRQCHEFMKLAMQGVSVVVASGDSGVGGRGGTENHCLGEQNNVFSPTYPANCPYLTSVGATEVPAGRTVFDPEVAAEFSRFKFSSGGGFSNVYPTPDYQASAVDKYLTQHKPPYPAYKIKNERMVGKGIYNAAGRGMPDVSANGMHIVSYTHREWLLNFGTSASAPIFASIINRINEQRLATGKTTLGFVNPSLYKNPSLLNDITEGQNPNCKTDGFKASTGWDPVTGLGTPSYSRMLDFFMSLP